MVYIRVLKLDRGFSPTSFVLSKTYHLENGNGKDEGNEFHLPQTNLNEFQSEQFYRLKTLLLTVLMRILMKYTELQEKYTELHYFDTQ